jgi:hypothetical protein
MTTTNPNNIAERVARIRGIIAMTHLPPVAGADRVLRQRGIYIRDSDRSWHKLEALCWTPEHDDELHGEVVTECCEGLIPLECVEEWTMDAPPVPLDRAPVEMRRIEQLGGPRPAVLDQVGDLELFDECLRRKLVTITEP